MTFFLYSMYIANIIAIVIAIVLLQVEFVLDGNRGGNNYRGQRNFCIFFLIHIIVNFLLAIMPTAGVPFLAASVIYNITYPLAYCFFCMMLLPESKAVRGIMIGVGALFTLVWTIIDVIAYHQAETPHVCNIIINSIDILFLIVIVGVCAYWLKKRREHFEEPGTRIMLLMCLFMIIYLLCGIYYDVTAYVSYYYTSLQMKEAYIYQLSLILFLFISILLSYYAVTNINKYKLLSSVAYNTIEENRNHIIEKANLSNREKEVLELALEGMSSTAIAQELYVTPSTVKKHLGSIYRKMGLKNRYELLALLQATERPDEADQS